MANPRWLTAGEFEAEDGLQTITKIFTNDEILSATAPLIVIPSTETLDYASFPTKLFKIISAYAILDASAGAYSNTGGNTASLILAWGSDWSIKIAQAATLNAIADTSPTKYNFVSQVIPDSQNKVFYSFVIGEDTVKDHSLQDNALVIAVDSASGDLQGGDSSNTLTVVVKYITVNL